MPSNVQLMDMLETSSAMMVVRRFVSGSTESLPYTPTQARLPVTLRNERQARAQPRNSKRPVLVPSRAPVDRGSGAHSTKSARKAPAFRAKRVGGCRARDAGGRRTRERYAALVPLARLTRSDCLYNLT